MFAALARAAWSRCHHPFETTVRAAMRWCVSIGAAACRGGRRWPGVDVAGIAAPSPKSQQGRKPKTILPSVDCVELRGSAG